MGNLKLYILKFLIPAPRINLIEILHTSTARCTPTEINR